MKKSACFQKNPKINAMVLALMILMVNGTLVSAENPMMQYPDIYDNTIVFVSGNDIWKAPADGRSCCPPDFQ